MGVIQLFSALFGLVLVGLGIAGYMPDYLTDSLLFGTFEINDMQNIFYIAIGGLGILAALSWSTARFYFKIFGIIFGIATIMGFALAGDLTIFHVNMADNILHLVLSVIALYFGFLHSSSSSI